MFSAGLWHGLSACQNTALHGLAAHCFTRLNDISAGTPQVSVCGLAFANEEAPQGIKALSLQPVIPTERDTMKLRVLLPAIAAVAISCAASAAPFTLDFENIAPYPNGNNVLIQNFYNGGTSSIGTSGTNHGVSFGNNALLLCLNSTSVTCSNASRGGLAPTSPQGSLFFQSGSHTYMNVAAGFDTGFSFNYVGNFSGSVGVYDGLNGTGNLLTSVSLTPNQGSCPGYGAQFCPFSPAGANFVGIARSVSFGGVANQIAFDDITFGSANPSGPVNPVPEPGSLALVGLALVGMATVSARRKAAKA